MQIVLFAYYSNLRRKSYVGLHHSSSVPQSTLDSKQRTLWNSLPTELRYPQTSSNNLSGSTNHLLALSASLFHSRLETHLFQQSFPPYSICTFSSSVLWFIRPSLTSLFHFTIIVTVSLNHFISTAIRPIFVYIVYESRPPSCISLAWSLLQAPRI